MQIKNYRNQLNLIVSFQKLNLINSPRKKRLLKKSNFHKQKKLNFADFCKKQANSPQKKTIKKILEHIPTIQESFEKITFEGKEKTSRVYRKKTQLL